MRFFVCMLMSAAIAFSASAAIKTEEIIYKQGDASYKGYLAYDDAVAGRKPAIIVVHEWWGHNTHARNQAERAAKLGYVGFAIDMYGEGKTVSHPKDAGEMATAVKSNPKLAHDRFMTAYEYVKTRPEVDADRIAAMGYCFGGSIVLEMARNGVDLDGVVSFHGALIPLDPAAPRNVKAEVLVCNGADDPFITQEHIDAFKKEMTDANAKFEFINLPGAKHSFTSPEADKVGIEGIAYNADADQKSWVAATALFKRVFGK